MANPANSVVNLVLAVTDQLTPAAKSIGINLNNLAKQVGQLSIAFLNLAANTGTFAISALNAIGSLPDAFGDLVSTLNEVSPLLDQMSAALEDIGQYSTAETYAGIGEALSSSLSLALPAFKTTITATQTLTTEIGTKLYPALFLLDQGIVRTVRGAEDLAQKAADLPGHLSTAFAIPSGAREPLIVFKAIKESVGAVSGQLFELIQDLGLFGLGLNALNQLVQSGPFTTLIGQNEELRQQLISTQATLAGTSKVLQGGTEVSDPTQAIQALSTPVKNAIADLRQGSLDLVGVTSKNLVPIFQVVAGQITQIGGSLDDATNLTLDFAAGLGTLGVPLYQANQEIRSIVTGTIDQNSILAQSLNITNQQVAKWKEQGILVQELNKRLAAFRAGNALNAQSISGIGSNIQEIFDEITRVAGEPLLQPIIKELDLLYKSLKTNGGELTQYISGLAADGLRAAQALYKSLQTLIGSIGEASSKIPVYVFETIANGAESLAEAIKGALVVLQPFINVFAQFAGAAISATGPFFTLFLQFKLLQGGIKLISGSLGTLFEIIPGLGELLFVLKGRTSGVLGTFLGLRKELGPLGAILLVLGKNLGALPPLFNKVAGAFPLIGVGIAQNIPLFANAGIAIAGAAKQSALFQEALEAGARLIGTFAGQANKGASSFELLGKGSGAVVSNLSALAGAAGLPLLSKELGKFSSELTKGTVVSSLFNESVKSVKNSIVSFLTGTVATTAALALFGLAFDKLILQNKNLLDALSGFGSFIKDISGSIFSFLVHPFTLATFAATGLAIAITTQTLPALVKLIQVQLAEFLLSGALNLAKFSQALAALKLFEMSAGALQVAQGLGLMSTALAGGTGALGAFGAGLAATAAGLFTLLAPLAAIAVGVAAIGFARQAKDLEQSNEAFEIYRQQSNAVADDALQIASKLKKASDRTAEAQRTGIALSNAEIATNAKLAQSGKLRLANLDEQIQILKLAQQEAGNDAVRAAFANQLAMLEATRKALEKYISTVQIAPRSLPELGNAFDQLEAKAKAAQKAIATPQGDVEVFKKKVEEYQQVTQQQVAIGAISLAEAEHRYRQISQLSTLEADAQIKAAEAAIGARKEQRKQETDLSNALVEQRKAAIAAGAVEEYGGYQSIFKLQQEDLERQKKATEELLIFEAKAGRGRGKIAKELSLEKSALETQLTTLTTEELNKRIELENRYLETAQSRLADTISQAEQSALQTTQALYNQRAITQTQADQQRVNATRNRLLKELALEQTHLEALQRLPQAKSPEKQEEQERQIRASQLKTAQLTTQLAEQQQRDQEALIKVIQERISREQRAIENLANRQNQAYEKQIRLLDRLNTALAFQNKLLDSRKNLQGAISDFLQTEYKILIDTAKTDEEKQKLARQAAKTELKFLAERQRLDREQLDIKLLIQRAEADRLRIQNQIDQLTAAANIKSTEAELAKAKANPQSTPEELDALKLALEAAKYKLESEQTKGDSLQTQSTFTQRQETYERRSLKFKQAGELDQKRLEYAKTLPEEQQEGYVNRLRRDIKQRVQEAEKEVPGGVESRRRTRVYTPTVGVGQYDPTTGEYTPARSRLPKVGTADLPSLKQLDPGTENLGKLLKEQVDFRPATQSLQELVILGKDANGILQIMANDPRLQVTQNTYHQAPPERSRSSRGLPR